ncbi:MAG: DUF1611 domain-containing protein [Rhodobacteraceae bacterium]|nr:DUF1611 domain-containing protein [Paracoccaceae bacterium]
MLDPTHPIALFAEATMGSLNAKMAEGILRYGRNPVVAVIDSTQAGKRVRDLCALDSDVPVVATLAHAQALGASVLVLGTAPSGGRLPVAWKGVLQQAIDDGMNLVNGMHDRLQPLFADRLRAGQWVWDLRVPQGDAPPIAMARAAALDNIRVLMVGTDMAIGKMTAGLELTRSLQSLGHDAAFLATGQTGIAITGRGIPLDAIRVDHAGGAVERMVLDAGGHEIVVVEGQGSLLHPGSTATLPLMRGSACTHMVLCHRAGMETLDELDSVRIPPLRDVIALNEAVARAGGALTAAKVVAIALNTARLSEAEARAALDAVEDETGLPTTDPVRHGASKLALAVTGGR